MNSAGHTLPAAGTPEKTFAPPATPVGLDTYFLLLKPRVMALVVFTALTGMVMAPASMPLPLAIAAITAIAMGAGAAGVFNMWYDRDIDQHMKRTAGRPLPSGRIAADDALGLGLLLACLSLSLMVVAAGIPATLLLAFSILYYAVFYTMWLKRRSDQNIVIGGAAGALPPVIGWCAASGDISAQAMILFALIFIWTPPHFWALSLWTHKEYAKVGIPMLPVTRGLAATRRWILIYSVILLPAGMAPALFGLAGPLYLAVSTGLGVWFLALAVRLWASRAGADDAPADIIHARRLFSTSIVYLFALFACLLVEALLFGPGVVA